jgi:hypothetical protein
MLNSLRRLLPVDNKLPRSLRGLLGSAFMSASPKVNYYCVQCLTRLRSPQERLCSRHCPLHNMPRLHVNIVELYWADVAHQIRLVAERHVSLIEDYSKNYAVLPCDIPNGSIFKQLPHLSSHDRHLTILLHTDGAPLVKVGGKSLWPIQATLVEIPPPLRDHNSAVMVFGAWLGGVHPDRDLLWANVVTQIKVSAQLVSLLSRKLFGSGRSLRVFSLLRRCTKKVSTFDRVTVVCTCTVCDRNLWFSIFPR